MKKFMLFLFVFFIAVNMGSWYAMYKFTDWWVATNILEELATSTPEFWQLSTILHSIT
jgi:ABC-type dipeptide/oligopeptide/nickel transport system permease component